MNQGKSLVAVMDVVDGNGYQWYNYLCVNICECSLYSFCEDGVVACADTECGMYSVPSFLPNSVTTSDPVPCSWHIW